MGGFTFEFHQPKRGKAQTAYEQNLRNYLGYTLVNAAAVLYHVHALPILRHKRFGPFIKFKELGSGTFGDVSLLARASPGQVFAGKTFKIEQGRDQRAEMEHEIRLLMKLSHVNIIKFLSYQRIENSYCVVMEYAPQGTLEKTSLDPPIIIGVVEQCLRALKYLHDKGIMHRDIKPANIILKSTYAICVKLADFGLATARQEGGVAGTVPFMAPEIFQRRTHTPAIDIWALGVTILDLFGKYNHRLANRLVADYQNHRLREQWFGCLHRSARGFPKDAAVLLLGMLQRDPRKRWSAGRCLRGIEPLYKCVQKDYIRYSTKVVASTKAAARGGMRRVSRTVLTLKNAFERLKNHRRTV